MMLRLSDSYVLDLICNYLDLTISTRAILAFLDPM
uniref:Uncharacterized protein n=1 Tax=Arundo donax TaxID=35708 RepID=A0A0A8ZIC3_ARUDO